MEGAFRGLAEAVFRWTEGLDLQQELADEGARAGAVADLADRTRASYAVTVHQVLTAARAVQARPRSSRTACGTTPRFSTGSAPRPGVGEATYAAARWWQEAAVLRSYILWEPRPQSRIPPPLRRRVPGGARALTLGSLPPPGRWARRQLGDAARADRPVARHPRPDDAPLWEPDRPHGVRAAKPLTDDERRRRDQLNREGAERTAQERERQRGPRSSQ